MMSCVELDEGKEIIKNMLRGAVVGGAVGALRVGGVSVVGIVAKWVEAYALNETPFIIDLKESLISEECQNQDSYSTTDIHQRDTKDYWGEIDYMFKEKTGVYTSFYADGDYSIRTALTQEGFNTRLKAGKTAGSKMAKLIKRSAKKQKKALSTFVVDIVSHSMGFAYSLGMIKELQVAGLKIGWLYAIAPENPSEGYVPQNIEGIWQYGSRDDDDYQVPLTLMTSNASVSATSYRWTVAGGSPIVSDDPSPTFTFTQPGEQTLILRAENDKNTHSVSKTITLYANTNLRTFSNVKFGINTAHNTDSIGAFFSTSTRKVYAKEALNEETAPLIDMVYFGLNKDFTFNRFVSPSSLAGLTFDPLPNAIHTTFINLQESCECSAALSVSAFDALSDDTDLRTMTIEETTAGIQDFDNTVSPRIVLFETADGRKGAIKIKGFISDGNYSYILTDIKVQKEAM